MKKELYEVTRVRGDEKKELGSYLLKPGSEAAMDFFHNCDACSSFYCLR